MRSQTLAAAVAACLAFPGLACAQGSVTRAPAVSSYQTAGTTSATPNTFTVALPLDSIGARIGCAIANTGTTTLLVYFRKQGATASIAAALPVAPGVMLTCHAGEQDEIAVASATASQPYVVLVR